MNRCGRPDRNAVPLRPSSSCGPRAIRPARSHEAPSAGARPNGSRGEFAASSTTRSRSCLRRLRILASRRRSRRARPGDFAILFRALSDVEHYEAALRRHGIDYYLVGGHAFYAQQEIYDLVNLLRAVASTSDTVSLVGVLRSGFFSLADETIFWLSQHPQGLSAGLAARAYPSEISPDQQRRARFAAQTMAELRERKDRLSVSRLIDEALERTGYDAALLNEFLGERKLANLRKLVEQARGFQRGGFGLPDFIAQLSEFVARQPDEPLAAMHSEDTNVVRLMSVHQSKGLEFPIVIVPDLGRPQRGPSENFHFDSTLGPLVKLPKGPDGPPPTAGYDLWRIVEKMEDAAEANRLLYVATTRAADQLILSAGTSHNGEPSGPWMHLLARRFDLATGRLVGPLPAGEAVPQIRVTAEEPPAKSTSRRAKVVDLGKLLDELTSLDASDAAVVATVDPLGPDPRARRHLSFSRLSGGLERRQETVEPASDGPDTSFDPRALGSLVHAVLAVIDFGEPVDCQKLVQLHAARRLAGPAADMDEATALIERFLASPRAAELAQASESHAEVEFLLAWPPDSSNPSPMVISGYLDRLYRDSAGYWHVLDFKTNRLARDGLAQQAAAYEMQMLLYGLATERILGVAPHSLVLHFLRGGQEHAFAWNEAARRRAVTLVGEAIAASLAARWFDLTAGQGDPIIDAFMLDPNEVRRRCGRSISRSSEPLPSMSYVQLRKAGFEALWAGGCVRDQLLGRQAKDFDVATTATPEEIRAAFGHRRTVDVGAAFGVIKVLGPKGAADVEVATFRQDATYSDGRHPDAVQFSTAEVDAQRRDFTINGLFYDPVEDAVIDYVGGQDDLARGIVRAIGDPHARFGEDKLRLLRAVRFAASFDFQLDPDTRTAIEAMAAEVTVVSAERIAGEMRLMLVHPRRARAIDMLAEVELLAAVLPELEFGDDPAARTPTGRLATEAWVASLEVLDCLATVEFPPSLAALLHPFVDAAGCQVICRRWKLSNHDTARACWLIENQHALDGAEHAHWPRLQRILIQPGIEDLLALDEAMRKAAGKSLDDIEFCRERLAWPRDQLDPPPLATGDDLVAHGVPRGKHYQDAAVGRPRRPTGESNHHQGRGPGPCRRVACGARNRPIPEMLEDIDGRAIDLESGFAVDPHSGRHHGGRRDNFRAIHCSADARPAAGGRARRHCTRPCGPAGRKSSPGRSVFC